LLAVDALVNNCQSLETGVGLVVKNKLVNVTRPVVGIKTVTLKFGTTADGYPTTVGADKGEK
jgi:hypothetical protein